ncbi:MAG: hypothetical protein LPK19_07345, partial [Hymenobacteraceae bacterium]|nr:hypothetical protein [Hymenobacteraceae bacterium]MDX5396024.1 hypothetical protein [Hymenobacteraceae bacterium]MDX5512086.1 hypothetical protein [Hymenobacteraceae bacterium]
HMLNAFKQHNLKAGDVLHYQDLYTYLQEKADHYKDAQKQAEQHLSKEGLVNPAPEGLRLTQAGQQALQSGHKEG